MDKITKSNRSFNLVGCISLHKTENNFGMPWKDYLIPVGEKKINALQRAVLECAIAGCKSVWISCNYDEAPYARKSVGHFILDPYIFYNSFEKFRFLKKEYIPIFFVPMNVTDLNVRDSMGWGIINSAVNADYVYKNLSKYVRPDRFYASFVQGCYNPWCLLDQRKKTKNTNHNFHLTFQGRSVKTNDYMGFTFSRKELGQIRSHVFKEGTGRNIFDESNPDVLFNKISLPIEERYSGKNFALDKVFEPVILDQSNSFELNQYFTIDNWSGYSEFMASSLKLRMPTVPLIKPRNDLAKIGMYDTPEIEYTEGELEEIITIGDDYYER
jgi:hypothetical protein